VLRNSRALRISRLLLWIMGLVLALISVSIPWPCGSEARVLGFPVPAAVFEQFTNASGESYWLDFVSPLTLPLLLVDFALCLFLPQTGLACILLVHRHERSAT
ncbi:MAG: hypothetical protein ACYS99_12480, partial [Planctomycetota bacterium]